MREQSSKEYESSSSTSAVSDDVDFAAQPGLIWSFNVTQGPAGENGARLRASLATQKKRLPILGNDDETANRQYIKHIVLDVDSLALRGVPSDRELGRRYGVEWAEAFPYIGPPASRLEQFIGKNAVPL